VNPTVKSIPEHFKNIIMGSYFGDGCITSNVYKKHHYLKISHSIKQAEYCKWKAYLFGNFAKEPVVYDRTFQNEPYQCISFSTKMFPFFDQLRECYIDGHKHIKKWMFNYMDPLAIAIWYMDDGDFSVTTATRTNGEKYRIFKGCRISLGIWSEEECKLITDFFA
jgi:recombination protein RecA